MEIFPSFLTTAMIIIFCKTKESEEIEIKTKYCFGFDNIETMNVNCTSNQKIIGNIEILKTQEMIKIKCMNDDDIINLPTDEEINWPEIFQDLNITKYYYQQKFESAQFENCFKDNELHMYSIIQPPPYNFTELESRSNNSSPFFHFKNLYSVTKLIISNNHPINFHSDLLQGLTNLKELCLTKNKIISLKISLDITNDEVTFIQPDIFENTRNLKILSISNNELKDSLHKNTFGHLEELETLDLSSNGIFSLDADLFNRQKNLKEIDLSHNNLHIIPQGLFNNCPSLRIIRMVNSEIRKLPTELFYNLKLLEIVDIQENALKKLSYFLFDDCKQLEKVNISRNKLKNLPIFTNDNFTSLRTLDVTFNELKTMALSCFDYLPNLRKLIFQGNHLTTISKSVSSTLTNLEVLDLSNNRLKNIEFGAFHNLTNLRTAIFYNTSLTFEENSEYSDFRYCTNIEELDLQGNLVNTIYHDWLSFKKLRKLNLSQNKLKILKADELLKFVPGVTVDLTNNTIQSVDYQRSAMLDSLQCMKAWCNETVGDEKVHLKLRNNPIVCDCNYYSFITRQQSIKLSAYSYLQIDVDESLCNDETSKDELIGILDLTCPINEIADQTVDCIPKCDCLFRPKGGALIVDCENKSFTKMPAIIPSAHFIKRTELDLKNNKIQYLDNMHGFHNITKLRLSNNKISQINPSITFSNLTVLHLDNNQLSSLDEEALYALRENKKLKVLSLHGNPWKCEDCAAKKLREFLLDQQKMISNITEITCDDKIKHHEIFSNDLCQPPIPLRKLDFGIFVIMFGLIVVACLIAFYYRYQHEIHVWLFAHNLLLWLVTEEELDRSKKYDAFISYSHLDEDFIVEFLVPELERGPHPFKLCLHLRDWIVGDWIPNQIVRSVEESRRTIVVLSPNFLNSVWGKMEFRTAHVTALNEGRARVIIIMYKEIDPIETLDAELAAYLKMNTYVKWGDPRFWDKLRYALPHQHVTL